MAYQSRKRNYKTRREKLNSNLQTMRTILTFFSIGLVVWLYMNRFELWAWLKTYLY